ncbi:short-chain dehydrogenase/reductase-like protein [Pyrenochaeta sp. DS3sAY3a]|nr:short-chain dehydrogenase/reductase-like protein [Pyrenochaeta sp. DS3sAY3a]
MDQREIKSGRLHGRIAIVTGASSGIGQAIAIAYAQEGAKVVCASRTELSPDQEISTCDIIRRSGGSAFFHSTDICSVTSVDTLVQKCVTEHGRLDILVNCAGVGLEIYDPQPIWTTSFATWEKTMSVNLTGIFNCCRAATAQMVNQVPLANGSRGWIVNISSVYGEAAKPGIVSYCSAKHAIIGLTKAAAMDCAPKNIYVNAICPGLTATSMTASVLPSTPSELSQFRAAQPLKGIGSPMDVARIAVVLGSDDVSWVTGVSVPVDGGFLCQ